MEMILYVHILAACAWIGGSILLFGLGVFIKDKNTQREVYQVIGPFYGYFETAWLLILLCTGLLLADTKNLLSLIGSTNIEIGYFFTVKILLVTILATATTVHLYISFATHTKERTMTQLIVSRASSMAIFLLNLGILWFAMTIRTILQ
jgi:uncharacterized membrane protein